MKPNLMINFCLIPRMLFTNTGTISYNKFVFASQRSQEQGNRFSIFLYQSSALDYISSSFFIVRRNRVVESGKGCFAPFKNIFSTQTLNLLIRSL